MSYRVYIGNLSYHATVEDIEHMFDFEGLVVTDIQIIYDKENPDKHRGIAFASLPNAKQYTWALEKINGFDLMDRKVIVRPAHERKQRILGERALVN